MRFGIVNKAVIAILLLLGLFALAQAGFAEVVTYEIYTLQPGDTRENLALRHGLRTEEIISIDNGPWQPGKRVALMKRYSQAPTPSPQPQQGAPVVAASTMAGPSIARVVRAGAEIRSDPGGGNFLFQPDEGIKVIVIAETSSHYGVLMADQSTGWVEKRALVVEGLLAADRPEIVQEAFRYLNLPYRYGGNLPYNTDCSLLVQQVFRSKGVDLPRTAAAQSQVGMAVTLDEARAGDRLYFINSRGRVSHTGIYLGNGQFIHASSNRGCVAVDKLAGSYLRRLVAIRRL